MQKLNLKAAALALGIACSAYMFLLGLAAMFGWGVKAVEVISSIYIGYQPTILGSIIGAIWGFIDGAVAGLIIALMYNYVVSKK